MKKTGSLRTILAAAVFLSLCGAAYAEENMALGKKYTLTPAPNYSYCTDSGDMVQLTDGFTTDRHFWTQPGCVGWNGMPWVDVTIDLEKVEPISSVAFNTAAGTAGVAWPMSALCYTSPNGDDWYLAGDLMMLDLEQNGARISTEYNARKISAKGLACKGRFVKILFHSDQFTFADEIEIGRGDASLLDSPYPEKSEEDPKNRAEREDYLNLVRSRYITDAGNAADLILEKSQTADSPKKEELETLAEQVRAVRADEKWLSELSIDTFRTVFPFDSVQAGLFASMAKMQRIIHPDIAPLLVERVQPYDAPNILTGAEPMAEDSLYMASGEIKPVVYQLLNTTEEPFTVSFSLNEVLDSLCQDVFAVQWTDTTHLVALAAALVPMTKTENGSYEVTVYPGLSAQIWIDVNTKGAEAGDYNGSIHFTAGNQAADTAEKPLLVQVSPVTLPEEQTLILGGWDYSDAGSHGPVTAVNHGIFISTIKKYGVNGPWATPGLLFAGVQANVSDPNNLKVTFNTESAEQWIANWPDAKEYYVFLAIPNKFCGYNFDTPEFKPLVADWAKKWGEWFESKGISPSRVSFLVHDEPGIDPNQDLRPFLAWCEAIRAGEKRFRIWEDPIYNPVTNTPKELLAACDTICPNRPMWMGNPSAFEEMFRPFIDEGRRFDLYSCSGPVLLLDPYTYHRLQAWQLFREGGTCSFFWAFFDGTNTPWNTYRETRIGFAPLFIDPESAEIIPAKQIAAMRESVYDFEILTMYKNRLDEAESNGQNVEAEKEWLNERIDAVIWAESAKDTQWPKAKDRTGADKLREEILHRLEAML